MTRNGLCGGHDSISLTRERPPRPTYYQYSTAVKLWIACVCLQTTSGKISTSRPGALLVGKPGAVPYLALSSRASLVVYVTNGLQELQDQPIHPAE